MERAISQNLNFSEPLNHFTDPLTLQNVPFINLKPPAANYSQSVMKIALILLKNLPT